jgi:hypothetical protein
VLPTAACAAARVIRQPAASDRPLAFPAASGELCDHTCDALVCTFAGLAVASTLAANAGGTHSAFAMWIVGTGPFCLATWRMFFTGTMTLPEFNGPNEGLALLYITHAATAFVGQARHAGCQRACNRAACLCAQR